MLVYLDQNITARLVNSPQNRLKKGEGYHLDLLVVALLVGICSLFGLPPLVAATGPVAQPRAKSRDLGRDRDPQR